MSLFLVRRERDSVFWRVNMDQPQRKAGRPRRGNIKATFKLSPEVLQTLALTTRTLGRGKSELVEEALRQYLHLPLS